MTANAALTLMAMGHCLFLALACTVFGGYKTLANRLMAFLLIAEGIRLLAVFAYIRADHHPSDFVEYVMLIRIVLAPTLYLYTRSLTSGYFQVRPRDFLHLIPLGISLLVVALNNNTDIGIPRPVMGSIQAYLTATTFIAYGVAATWRLRNYRRELKEHFSELDRHQLNWLGLAQYYLIFIGFVHIFSIIAHYGGLIKFEPGDPLMISILTTTVFVYILSISSLMHFHNLTRMGEKTAADEVDDERKVGSDTGEKYSSGLTETEVQHYLGLLTEYMESERPYLEHRLKLGDLGEALGLHPQQVSQIINQGAGVPFHDYINDYRINEVLATLSDRPQSIGRISGLYEDCGFSSQSTFYKHFKRVTGRTPRQYLQQAA